MSNPEFPVSFDQFKEWIDKQPEGQIGLRFNSHDCPCGKCFAELLQAHYVSVGTLTVLVNKDDLIVYDNPSWLSDIVDLVDQGISPSLTKQQLLDIVGGIRG